MTGGHPVLLGLLLYVAIAVAPPLVLWVSLRVLPAAVIAVCERRRADPMTRPALESVVANLRRLRRQVRDGPQRTQVRTVALLAAYDETLLEACEIVGVDAALAASARADRAFARLLTEAALEDAGVALDPATEGP